MGAVALLAFVSCHFYEINNNKYHKSL